MVRLAEASDWAAMVEALWHLAGAVAGQASLSGHLIQQHRLIGAIEAQGAADGTLTAHLVMAGAIAAQGAVSGDLAVNVAPTMGIVIDPTIESLTTVRTIENMTTVRTAESL